jgi:hypothetical protein
VKKTLGIMAIVLTVIGTISGCYLFQQTSALTVFELDNATINIEVGEQTYLHVVAEPVIEGMEVACAQTNDAIADMLVAGKVISIIGKAPGMTTLTVSSLGKKSTCLVTVTNNGSINPGGDDYYLEPDESLITLAPNERITLGAELVNGERTDQRDIVWTSFDPSIVNVFGSGSSALITAKRSGMTQVILTHSKADANVAINVLVEDGRQSIYLNKTNLTLAIGDTYDISARVSTNVPDPDWQTVVWGTTTPSNEVQIISILGNGQEVGIQALAAGETRLTATTINGAIAYCDIRVTESKRLYFSQNTVNLEPFETTEIGFVLTPINEQMDWYLTNNAIATFSYDLGTRLLYINGLKEGTSTLVGQSTDGILYDFCEVICEYVRAFDLSSYSVYGDPVGPTVISYTMNPYSDPVSATSSNPNVATVQLDPTAHTITVTPRRNNVEASTTIECIGAGIARTISVDYVFTKDLTVDESSLYNLNPHAGPRTVQFHQSPAVWNCIATSSNEGVATVTVNNTNDTFTVTPHREGSFNIHLSGSGYDIDIPGSFVCNHSWDIRFAAVSSSVGVRAFPDMYAADDFGYKNDGTADTVFRNTALGNIRGGIWVGIATGYDWGLDCSMATFGGFARGSGGIYFAPGTHVVQAVVLDDGGNIDPYIDVSISLTDNGIADGNRISCSISGSQATLGYSNGYHALIGSDKAGTLSASGSKGGTTKVIEYVAAFVWPHD